MNWGLIAAAGQGKRMQLKSGQKKPYLLLGGRPLLAYSLEVFDKCKLIDKIIVIVGKSQVSFCKENIVARFGFGKVFDVVEGGKKRQDSIFEGLKVLPTKAEVVVVHDGARPFVTADLIESAFSVFKDCDGVVTGVLPTDTVKAVDEKEEVLETLERKKLVSVQTPQIFLAGVLKKAYDSARKDSFYGTDDATLVEKIGGRIKIAKGSYGNIKITTPFDLEVAEAILSQKKEFEVRQ